MGIFSKSKKNDEFNIEDLVKIPKHIAIIMDGNGRWAKKRGLPRSVGHKAGVEAIRDIVKESSKLGVEFLTIYAFSTENWNRPIDEVNGLMKLLVEYLKGEFNELNENNVIINYIGNIDKLPMICQDELRRSKELTKNNSGLTLNLALNYGGRNDVLNAVQNIAHRVKKGEINPEEISEEMISENLYTGGMPDPDLMIRTSGEQRQSNFLIWQLAYTEFYFTDVLWPDFKAEDLHKALFVYQSRDRRFGAIK